MVYVQGKQAILREIWRQRLHTEPSALESSVSPWDSIWEPGERLLEWLARLPGGLLSFWLRCGRGHVVIGVQPSGYAPGWHTWRDQRLEGICRLRASDIQANAQCAWSALLSLFDHVMGSAARAGGPCLSDGQGACPRLQQVAPRLTRAIELGYAGELRGSPDADQSSYLVLVWRLYLEDPARLATLDPLSHRLLADSLMDEGFWRLVLAETDAPGSQSQRV